MPPKNPETKGEARAKGTVKRPRHRAGWLRIAILSRNRKLYSTRRLVEAARAHGHEAQVLDTLRCNLVLAIDAPRVFYKGAEVSGIGVVIPRIGASITGYGLSVVNQFDMMGVPSSTTPFPSRARATSCAPCSSSPASASTSRAP
jgi:ribosomal protein S6--L-glutamate ligase